MLKTKEAVKRTATFKAFEIEGLWYRETCNFCGKEIDHFYKLEFDDTYPIKENQDGPNRPYIYLCLEHYERLTHAPVA